MSAKTSIEWTDASWNPVRGCWPVSEGCLNCYAARQAVRFSGPGKAYEGLVRSKGQWNGEVRLVPELLDQPLRWGKPRRVFVCSMSDLFHPEVPFEYIAAVFAVMKNANALRGHVFQVLTKRPARMRTFISGWHDRHQRERWMDLAMLRYGVAPLVPSRIDGERIGHGIWLGVSVENQKAADERIPHLLQTPAAVHYLSLEPLLEDVNIAPAFWPTCWHWASGYRTPEEAIAAGAYAEKKPQALASARRNYVRWIIVGGESGPGARPCNVEWIRSIVQQCREAGVSCFVKQLGAYPIWGEYGGASTAYLSRCAGGVYQPKGADPDEWPEDLRVREYPAP